MFLIDFEAGRMIPDEEIKSHFAAQLPYGDWLGDDVDIAELSPAPTTALNRALPR